MAPPGDCHPTAQQSRAWFRSYQHGGSSQEGTGIGPSSRQPMSALGQKQTCALQNVMSALPPKADMCGATRDVRFGPKADIAPTSDERSNARQDNPDLGELAELRIDLD